MVSLTRLNVLCVHLRARFDTFNKADTAASWVSEWSATFNAGNWNVGVGESGGQLHAGSAAERKEFGAWVWNKGLLLAAVAFVFLGWMKKVVIECGHRVRKGSTKTVMFCCK